MHVLGKILKILTFPLRLVVVVIALILRAILWMLAFIIENAIGALGIIGYLISVIMIFGAVAATIACIMMVKNGDLTVLQSVVLIGITWIGSSLLSMAFVLCEMVAEFLAELGEIIWEAALDLLTI